MYPRIIQRTILLFMLFAGISACRRDDVPPEDFLPADSLALILSEMHIAQAGVNNLVTDQKKREKLYFEMNAAVLERFKVSRELFDKSYGWYEERPAMTDTLYGLVMKRLNMISAPLEQEQRERAMDRVKPALPKPEGEQEAPKGQN